MRYSIEAEAMDGQPTSICADTRRNTFSNAVSRLYRLPLAGPSSELKGAPSRGPPAPSTLPLPSLDCPGFATEFLPGDFSVVLDPVSPLPAPLLSRSNASPLCRSLETPGWWVEAS